MRRPISGNDRVCPINHCRRLAKARKQAEPEELGHVVEFLLSARAGYITGQAIFVDGGATINGDW